MTNINYMQTGAFHCFRCHMTFADGGGSHLQTCLAEPTPCTEKCGRWFSPPQEEKLREEWNKKAKKAITTYPYSDTEELNDEHSMIIKFAYDFFMSSTISKAELREWLHDNKQIVPLENSQAFPLGYNQALTDLLTYLK